MSEKSGRLAAALVAVVVLALAAPAAGLAAPELTLTVATPDFVQAGESAGIVVHILNTGNTSAHGPFVIADEVGANMEAPVEPIPIWRTFATSVEHTTGEPIVLQGCETTGLKYSCTVTGDLLPSSDMYLRMQSAVSPSATGVLTNQVSVKAADVSEQDLQQQMRVGEPGSFAIDSFAATLIDGAKQPLTQAASVPADFTTHFSLASESGQFLELLPVVVGVEQPKDVTVHLPVGLIGNPTAASLCRADQLAEGGEGLTATACPVDSQVGTAQLMLGGMIVTMAPLYNMVAPPGAATELAFSVLGTVVTLDAYVRPGDHGIDVVSRDTSSTLPVTDVAVTAWGDPASPSHDRERGVCYVSGAGIGGANGDICPSEASEKAFLRMPTSCSGEGLPFAIDTNTYGQPERYVTRASVGPILDGCQQAPFSPTIYTQPTATAANSPTGVAVQVRLPQTTNPSAVGEADLEKAVVTLPEGMALNPSSADGLQACGDSQFKADQAGVAECPDASKVGTVLLHTPLLETPIEGSVYVLSQESSDPESGNMFRIGMELRDDRHGIDIKVVGHIDVNKTTGRLTTTFDNNPELPFSDITLHFKSGARAPLTTPFSCQSQTTEADLYSWAQPSVATHRNMTFQLTSGPEGTPCTSTPGFAPGFNAGVSSVQAGGFTPFLTTFSRKDSDQSMQRVSVKLPKGLLGSLIGLPLCPEAQANAGTCPKESEIGSVTAGAGDGPTPFYVTGGHVYMTQSYEGAPFGLSVVVPAKAGPFDLGNVVVRAKVEVDVHTAQLTVTTDPLPQIVGGVPVNLRLVNVTVNRPNFTYNPTRCEPSEVSGRVTGGQGAVANVSNRFQVTNCGALKFQPKFKVSTTGKTSRRSGAGLTAELTYPKTAQGVESNIAKVKVSLPRQLPSRLSTLQKACTAATFAANPANCPAASRVGIAKAVTPVLPVPLTGPAYFVSHGGEAFPDLVVVLQGYGVTVDLVGTTFISKSSVTTSTFKQVPDVPVGSFELTLPQGPNSALAANGNLCTVKLNMPTIFVGQDGAEIKRNTPVTPTGCAKHKVKQPKGKGKK